MRRQILVDIQTVRSCENPSSGSHSDTREQRQTEGLDAHAKTANPHKTKIPNNFFFVLLTVHLSIMLVINQLDAQNLVL